MASARCISRGRAGDRHSVYGRFQQGQQRGLRLFRGEPEARPALERGERVPEARPFAQEPDADHACPRRARADRGSRSDGDSDPTQRCNAHDHGEARGDRLGGRGGIARDPGALRNRRWRAVAGDRRSRGAAPAGRGREFAGSSATALRVQGAGRAHDERGLPLQPQAHADRAQLRAETARGR